MSKVARCKDTGLNCEFVIRGETVEELLENASEHANAAHPSRVAGSIGLGADLTGVLGGMVPGADAVGADRRRDWLAKVSEAAQDE